MNAKSTRRCRTDLRAAAASLLLFAAGPLAAQPPGEPIELEIPPVSGVAGDSVEMNVVLHTGGQEVAGIQIDVEAPPSWTFPISDEGGPDCWRNTELDKDYTVYSFPEGQRNRMRALVLSLTNVRPIPDGSLLFTCRIDIDASAEAGEYQLSALRLGGSTPDGDAIETVGSGGTVLVADPQEDSVPLTTGANQTGGGCAIGAAIPGTASAGLLALPLLLWGLRHKDRGRRR